MAVPKLGLDRFFKPRGGADKARTSETDRGPAADEEAGRDPDHDRGKQGQRETEDPQQARTATDVPIDPFAEDFRGPDALADGVTDAESASLDALSTSLPRSGDSFGESGSAYQDEGTITSTPGPEPARRQPTSTDRPAPPSAGLDALAEVEGRAMSPKQPPRQQHKENRRQDGSADIFGDSGETQQDDGTITRRGPAEREADETPSDTSGALGGPSEARSVFGPAAPTEGQQPERKPAGGPGASVSPPVASPASSPSVSARQSASTQTPLSAEELQALVDSYLGGDPNVTAEQVLAAVAAYFNSQGSQGSGTDLGGGSETAQQQASASQQSVSSPKTSIGPSPSPTVVTGVEPEESGLGSVTGPEAGETIQPANTEVRDRLSAETIEEANRYLREFHRPPADISWGDVPEARSDDSSAESLSERQAHRRRQRALRKWEEIRARLLLLEQYAEGDPLVTVAQVRQATAWLRANGRLSQGERNSIRSATLRATGRVRGRDEKSPVQIAAERRDQIERARRGEIILRDAEGNVRIGHELAARQAEQRERAARGEITLVDAEGRPIDVHPERREGLPDALTEGEPQDEDRPAGSLLVEKREDPYGERGVTVGQDFFDRREFDQGRAGDETVDVPEEQGEHNYFQTPAGRVERQQSGDPESEYRDDSLGDRPTLAQLRASQLAQARREGFRVLQPGDEGDEAKHIGQKLTYRTVEPTPDGGFDDPANDRALSDADYNRLLNAKLVEMAQKGEIVLRDSRGDVLDQLPDDGSRTRTVIPESGPESYVEGDELTADADPTSAGPDPRRFTVDQVDALLDDTDPASGGKQGDYRERATLPTGGSDLPGYGMGDDRIITTGSNLPGHGAASEVMGASDKVRKVNPVSTFADYLTLPGSHPIGEAYGRLLQLGISRTHPGNMKDVELGRVGEAAEGALEYTLRGVGVPGPWARTASGVVVPGTVQLTGSHPLEQASHLAGDVLVPGYEQARKFPYTSLTEKAIIGAADAAMFLPGGKVLGKPIGAVSKATTKLSQRFTNTQAVQNIIAELARLRRLDELWKSGSQGFGRPSTTTAKKIHQAEQAAQWEAFGASANPQVAAERMARAAADPTATTLEKAAHGEVSRTTAMQQYLRGVWDDVMSKRPTTPTKVRQVLEDAAALVPESLTPSRIQQLQQEAVQRVQGAVSDASEALKTALGRGEMARPVQGFATPQGEARWQTQAWGRFGQGRRRAQDYVPTDDEYFARAFQEAQQKAATNRETALQSMKLDLDNLPADVREAGERLNQAQREYATTLTDPTQRQNLAAARQELIEAGDDFNVKSRFSSLKPEDVQGGDLPLSAMDEATREMVTQRHPHTYVATTASKIHADPAAGELVEQAERALRFKLDQASEAVKSELWKPSSPSGQALADDIMSRVQTLAQANRPKVADDTGGRIGNVQDRVSKLLDERAAFEELGDARGMGAIDDEIGNLRKQIAEDVASMEPELARTQDTLQDIRQAVAEGRLDWGRQGASLAQIDQHLSTVGAQRTHLLNLLKEVDLRGNWNPYAGRGGPGVFEPRAPTRPTETGPTSQLESPRASAQGGFTQQEVYGAGAPARPSAQMGQPGYITDAGLWLPAGRLVDEARGVASTTEQRSITSAPTGQQQPTTDAATVVDTPPVVTTDPVVTVDPYAVEKQRTDDAGATGDETDRQERVVEAPVVQPGVTVGPGLQPSVTVDPYTYVQPGAVEPVTERGLEVAPTTQRRVEVEVARAPETGAVTEVGAEPVTEAVVETQPVTEPVTTEQLVTKPTTEIVTARRMQPITEPVQITPPVTEPVVVTPPETEPIIVTPPETQPETEITTDPIIETGPVTETLVGAERTPITAPVIDEAAQIRQKAQSEPVPEEPLGRESVGLLAPTDVIKTEGSEHVGRTVRKPRDDPSQPLEPIVAAPRPPGAYPRSIEHDETIEYRLNPETGQLDAQVVESSEPVVTGWDMSSPQQIERQVGTWDVVPGNDDVLAQNGHRVSIPSDLQGQIIEEARRTGQTVTVTLRYQHDLDTQETDTRTRIVSDSGVSSTSSGLASLEKEAADKVQRLKARRGNGVDLSRELPPEYRRVRENGRAAEEARRSSRKPRRGSSRRAGEKEGDYTLPTITIQQEPMGGGSGLRGL